MQEPRGAEQPVGDVPERAAEDERERDEHDPVLGAVEGPHEDGDERRRRATARSGVTVWNRLNALPVLRAELELDGAPDDRTPARCAGRRRPRPWWPGRGRGPRRRCRRPAGGAAGAALRSASALGTRLAVDAHLRPRDRLEPLERDLAPRGLAHAVLVALHPIQRVVDLLDHLAGRRREQQVPLALDVDGVALAGLLVELGVARLALAGELLRLGGEVVRLMEEPRLLVDELLAEPVEGLGAQVRRAGRDLEARTAGR